MTDQVALKQISGLLAEKYGKLGKGAAARIERWLSGEMPYAWPEVLARHLDSRHLGLLFDAFWQELPFGTGGRRGRVGYGPNRLNPTTVAMTVQGHCNHLRKVFPGRKRLKVVVANDVRIFKDIAQTYRFLGKKHPLFGTSSRSLAKLACEIYAGNGVTAYLNDPGSDEAVLTTPELSFLIHKLHGVGGINISASHNPPDDNGVKVYDEYGSQPIAPDDQRLVEAMKDANGVSTLPFEEALREGLIRGIPADLHRDYVERYVRVYGNLPKARPDLPLVYTPLCGCGQSTVGEVLDRLGFCYLVPPRQEADGTFAEIPFKAANPEVPEATTPAKLFAEQKGCGIVLSSDPDADRVGLEARLADGSWYHFDGNQIAAILCYFLMVDPKGPRRRGLVIETLVTTRLLGQIVGAAPGSFIIDNLLVGFKYVADVLKSLKRTGRYQPWGGRPEIRCSPKKLVLAAEESHGVLVVPEIRDKDATPACIYLAALYQRLHSGGRTLLDYYCEILEKFGPYDAVNRSITMSGAEGNQRKERLLESLRESPPRCLGGEPVTDMADYWDQKQFGKFVSETDRLPRNVIQYFTDHHIITVRPSGTEPKLKFYCQSMPDCTPSPAGISGLQLLREARTKAERTSRLIYNELLSRIDFSLGEAALLLPDIVDLDCKRQFERQTVPQLRDGLASGRFGNLPEVLTWLRNETADMTPGADPLPALKGPVACLLSHFEKELARTPLLAALEQWARP